VEGPPRVGVNETAFGLGLKLAAVTLNRFGPAEGAEVVAEGILFDGPVGGKPLRPLSGTGNGARAVGARSLCCIRRRVVESGCGFR
jgi:hypothetical protein